MPFAIPTLPTLTLCLLLFATASYADFIESRLYPECILSNPNAQRSGIALQGLLFQENGCLRSTAGSYYRVRCEADPNSNTYQKATYTGTNCSGEMTVTTEALPFCELVNNEFAGGRRRDFADMWCIKGVAAGSEAAYSGAGLVVSSSYYKSGGLTECTGGELSSLVARVPDVCYVGDFPSSYRYSCETGSLQRKDYSGDSCGGTPLASSEAFTTGCQVTVSGRRGFLCPPRVTVGLLLAIGAVIVIAVAAIIGFVTAALGVAHNAGCVYLPCFASLCPACCCRRKRMGPKVPQPTQGQWSDRIATASAAAEATAVQTGNPLTPPAALPRGVLPLPQAQALPQPQFPPTPAGGYPGASMPPNTLPAPWGTTSPPAQMY